MVRLQHRTPKYSERTAQQILLLFQLPASLTERRQTPIDFAETDLHQLSVAASRLCSLW
ncbi:unnamed protein product [Acanthoscelides obtectus]|uniref:Uncharacterized protein n=1 Tax=Acanthoscelides obtectus TaxID=200917 RepID=A0A9P0NWJ3_ACAOB|nr:unnamed protein product [Acanthoscelides obtectus]CAK1652956.1 hypothetical protein AOBTE_LOCUS17986 [Acanthoscelides obtectus]